MVYLLGRFSTHEKTPSVIGAIFIFGYCCLIS